MLSQARLRTVLRWGHVGAGILLIAYVCFTSRQNAIWANTAQFVVLPLIVVSGVWMLQQGRIARWMRPSASPPSTARQEPRDARSLDGPGKGPRVPHLLELATTIGLALMAGFLFNMSVVTAPALNALSPEQALAAWKGINATVRNPLFAGTAFGTALLVVACAAVAWRSRRRGWCLTFALLYLIGVIGTTFAVESSINHAIILATTPPPELRPMLSTWLLGNHIRALSALAAFIVAWLGFQQSATQHT